MSQRERPPEKPSLPTPRSGTSSHPGCDPSLRQPSKTPTAAPWGESRHPPQEGRGVLLKSKGSRETLQKKPLGWWMGGILKGKWGRAGGKNHSGKKPNSQGAKGRSSGKQPVAHSGDILTSWGEGGEAL